MTFREANEEELEYLGFDAGHQVYTLVDAWGDRSFVALADKKIAFIGATRTGLDEPQLRYNPLRPVYMNREDFCRFLEVIGLGFADLLEE